VMLMKLLEISELSSWAASFLQVPPIDQTTFVTQTITFLFFLSLFLSFFQRMPL